MTKQERLKAAAVIFTAAADGKQIQWEQDDVGWTNVDPFGDEDYGNVRKHPECYRIKPEPKTRPWSKPEDVPGPVCWVRSKQWSDGGDHEWLIHGVTSRGIRVLVYGNSDASYQWDSLERIRLEYSTDRKNWSPCVVTEEAQ